MSPIKRFLLVFFVVYTLGGIVGMVFWGPPNFSSEYLDEFGRDHEHYRSIVSSEHYRLYEENPEMHPLEGHYIEDAAFVEEYTSRPAYIAERKRIDAYVMFFDFYNVLAVIVLAMGAGWKPLRGFLDKKIAEHREQIESARQAREAAESRLADVHRELAGLPEEVKALEAQGAARAAQTVAENDAGTEAILAQLDEEIAARKAAVERQARMQVRRELVDKALELAEQELTEHLTPERQHALLREFTTGLEAKS